MAKHNLKFLLMVFLTTLASFAFAADWVPVKEFDIKYPLFIPGIYRQGSDVTEPKKMKSRFLQVEDGGVLLTQAGAKLFVRARSLTPPEGEMYFKAEFPNPARPDRPFTLEMDFKKDGTFMFTSPNVIRGLQGKDDFIITINVFDKKDPGRPVDSVVQKVRSYVDTQEDEILIFDGIIAKEK